MKHTDPESPRIFSRADLDAAVAVEREACVQIVVSLAAEKGETSFGRMALDDAADAIRARSPVAAPSYVREPPPPEAMGGPPRDELFGPAEEALAIANEMLLEQRDALRAEVENELVWKARAKAAEHKSEALQKERDAAEARADALEAALRDIGTMAAETPTDDYEYAAIVAKTLAAHGKGAR
jgi:hypothetical protein